jgi:hypothetical protein
VPGRSPQAHTKRWGLTLRRVKQHVGTGHSQDRHRPASYAAWYNDIMNDRQAADALARP